MLKIPSKLPKEITDKYSVENNTFLRVAKNDPRDKLEVEVGDIKQADFFPQIKLKRWDASLTKRNKLGQFTKGNVPFDRTGIPHSEETKKKLKKARKGRQPRKPIDMEGKRFGRWTVLKFAGKKEGQYAWLCRCDCGNERVVRGSSLRSGQSKSCGCLQKELITERNKRNRGEKSPTFGKKGFFAGKKRPEVSERMRGKNNPNWKNGITPEARKIRNSIRFKEWRKKVFERDGYICQKYKTKGGKLNAHHILDFSEHPELRFDVSNGITLSEKAHREFHRIYGIKNNTKEQLEEFLMEPIIKNGD